MRSPLRFRDAKLPHHQLVADQFAAAAPRFASPQPRQDVVDYVPGLRRAHLEPFRPAPALDAMRLQCLMDGPLIVATAGVDMCGVYLEALGGAHRFFTLQLRPTFTMSGRSLRVAM